MANDLMTEYENVNPEEGVNPPKNYRPLSQDERQQWNNFIRYINVEKKMGGDKALDARDKSLGNQLMEEYRKKNPNFTITPDQIQNIQYEFNMMRDLNALPDQSNLNDNVKTIIRDYYPPEREISGTDGWLGSLTSKQAYPEIQEFSDDPLKQKWGLNYRGASEYANSSKRWSKKK